MLQNTKAKKHTYALKTYADYRAQILENRLAGLLLKMNDNEVWTKLIGSFNAYNLLSIYATAELLGLEEIEILRLISELESVSGRFEYFITKNKITAIIDYAHTPDALKNVLETINKNYKKTLSITDRKQAIKTACQLAAENDIILIAGKGHETYQEVHGKRTDFDDYKIAKEILDNLNE